MLQIRQTIVVPVIVGLLALLFCFLAYRPGLSSGFFFDDAANLPALGESGRVNNTAVFLRYVTSGRADLTGRPISLLSFLLDANDWPASPAPFKRTNLLLHLVCGALLFWLLNRLGVIHGLSRWRAQFSAGFAAFAWLVHPLFVSTVLYVVQREAMLPAFFVLCGLHLWLSARRRMLAEGQFSRLLFSGMAFCTLLAFLSKPNGILLPVLALVIDVTLPPSGSRDGRVRYRRWRNTLLVPFSLAVIAGLCWVLVGSFGKGLANGRSFTLSQRILTEPTVLIDYLRLLFLFDPSYGSLFHDQYRAATDPLHPWFTLPAMLACLGACVAAWVFRRRAPFAAAATLFFFSGHLIESTSLALELYFEHRNYLPSMLLFWPIGVLLTGERWRAASTILALIILAGLAAMTYSTALLWSRPLSQARFWAAEAPNSPRAQAYAAQVEADFGYTDAAIHRIDDGMRRFPAEPQIAFNLIDLHCAQGKVSSENWIAAEQALRDSSRDPGALLAQWTGAAIAGLPSGRCQGMDEMHLVRLLDVASTNPQIARLPGRMQDISNMRGLLALENNDPHGALMWFNDALRRDPGSGVALEQAARLGATGHPNEGLAHLRYYDTLAVVPVQPTKGMHWVHARLLDHQGYWESELKALRETLSKDTAKATP